MGLLASGATSAIAATPVTSVFPVFASAVLVPGDAIQGTLTIPAASTTLMPYLRALRIQQTCGHADCPTTPHGLADLLLLTATAPGGQIWRGTFAALAAGTTLPGGTVSAGQTRTYRLGLVLPASTSNQYEDMSVSAQLEWGGQDSAGTPVTAVLGETFSKGATSATRNGGAHGGALPFTGLDAERLVVLALVAVASGSYVLAASRRKRREVRAGAER
jgi:hypothetical protein